MHDVGGGRRRAAPTTTPTCRYGDCVGGEKKYDIIMTSLRHYYDIIMTFL